MKIRIGFVSNSSSSSFIINKKNLNEHQLESIRNHKDDINEFQKEVGYECSEGDAYSIIESDEYIVGTTSMDNYQIELLIEKENINGLKFVETFDFWSDDEIIDYLEELENEE